MLKQLFSFFFFVVFVQFVLFGQKKTNEEIRVLVDVFKKDARGPYKDIRWFCPDGSILPAKTPCPGADGVQHATYKDAVEQLGQTNHVFLGQILASTSRTDFWDEKNDHSRLKQYQLEKYLRAVDDGWIMRKGQFYRGALQVEDEEAWGIRFFQLILSDADKINKHFFLIRQAAKDIPHRGDSDRTQHIRALSKSISESYEPFFNLRVKLHGQPSAADLKPVKDFLEGHRKKMDKKTVDQFEEMIADMEVEYQPAQLASLTKYANALAPESNLKKSLNSFIYNYKDIEHHPGKLIAMARLLRDIRMTMPRVESGQARLALLDLSIDLEEIYTREAINWNPYNLDHLLNRIYYTGMAAMGCGYIEIWEWEKFSAYLLPLKQDQINLADLIAFHEYTRSLVEMSIGMNNAVFEEVVDLYVGFEPLAYGFLDDKIRSSVLLPLGKTASLLGDFIASRAKFSNQVMDISNQSSIRGLNPGYAFGELVVVEDAAKKIEVSKDKIYLFNRTTANLNPVAGIVTVSEGNLVSHVQLLARNLGIPNAVLSPENFKELKKYSGEKVFYAVSDKGTVIMKPESQMSKKERELFEVKKRSNQKIAIPTTKIDLEVKDVLDLRKIRSEDSGKICGPKAANLGQLKVQFPEMVTEGLVIPFGIFREHMDQKMPGKQFSYWEHLNKIFAQAVKMPDEAAAEDYILEELKGFQVAIQQIRLDQQFVESLKSGFSAVLGKPMGNIPVFVRSDTNMEDLKDFTGAGLNLTLFNVVEEEKILQGIRDVWASPFSERSYKWRQKYLLNPENVYPSILIIPSVNVDYSGVLITSGVNSGDPSDLTVAFNRGVGGAVEGQAAESYLLKANGENFLLFPAREPKYRTIPPSGGSMMVNTTFEQPVLKPKNLESIIKLAGEVREIMPRTPGMESEGPFDIELGFINDRIWLFQIRPFAENKNAKGSDYLKSITPKLPVDDPVSISTPL